ncbi:MAG: AraC family transcriptional regulator [Lachnospiraceae bacterium]|nr:AraC family transcriptional regulator [Lachnospiraceae bacterium]
MIIEYGQHTLYIEKQIRKPSFGMNYEHTHNYCEIYYLKSGSCTYTANSKKYHLTPGDLFIVRSGDPHSSSYNGVTPSERIVIACNPDLLPADLFEMHPDIKNTLYSTGKVVLSPSLKKNIESIFEKMLSESNKPDDYSSDFMMVYTINILLLLQRGGVFVHEHAGNDIEVSPVIEQAINYIALNYQNPVTLDEISEILNLCPSYFSKKFKTETGSTFKEYLNYIRLKQATQMLLTTDDSITKIALNCGFNSSNYFKDSFKKKQGMSPRDFRNTLSNPAVKTR